MLLTIKKFSYKIFKLSKRYKTKFNSKICNNNNDKYTLLYFILQSNTLKLYREIFKYTSKIKNIDSRQYLRKHIRQEFSRDIKLPYNSETVKYKLGTARKKINELKDQINMTL